jgi:hypothetical protein
MFARAVQKNNVRFQKFSNLSGAPTTQRTNITAKSHHNDFQRNVSGGEKPAKRPALFTSSVGSSNKESAKPSDNIESGFQWQKADFV